MPWKFKESLKEIAKKQNFKLLKNSCHGLEIERLRVSKTGEYSQDPHPEKLGAALTNPFITTDFSESQLELITPPLKQEKRALTFLKELTVYTSKNIGDELLWPLSVPTRLPKKEEDIPIAQYGKSLSGQRKTIYRNGLGLRYGRKMQTVSGIHYNFSFSEEFWDFFYKKYGGGMEKKEFIANAYFKMLRNFRRYGWINTYLFGATPAVDKSYLRKRVKGLKKFGKSTYYGPYATSLRLSEVGYYSKVQAQLAVSYNSIEEYMADLGCAINTVKPKYKKFKGQLNPNILQLENEFYSIIRPKQPPVGKEGVLEALEKNGVKYLEIRSVDNDPYDPVGVHNGQICFLNLLSIYCLLKNSPKFTKEEHQEVNENQMKVAMFGRKKNLKLKYNGEKILMKDWAIKILSGLHEIAATIDQNFSEKCYFKTLKLAIEKVENPDLTPSAIILKDIKKKGGLVEFGLELAKKHKKTLAKESIPPTVQKRLDEARDQSFLDQKRLEFESEYYLEGYEDMEVSTQLLIREAKKRKVDVEILDRKANFIRLKKGRKVEFVKQATKTAKDSYMTFLIMESKQVTKRVLKEHEMTVPEGRVYSSPKDAIEDYERFSKIPVVIKPNNTNYGIGISFIDPGEKDKFEKKIHEAFKHDNVVIVEEYFKGGEYRLFVIGGKMLGVIHRVPSNVTGDGKHTIEELAELRNKFEKNVYKMRIGEIEKEELKKQKLSPKSVLKKGRTVYLRKNSNVSTGGDPIDMTDEMPEYYKKVAVEAAAAVKAGICGVDMIIDSLKSKPSKENYRIIELNFNPALEMHHFPFKGKKRDLASAVLDFLGF